eukprot:SAG22_NODE_3883_length_1484_cov_1.541516_2_plen_109_part_00
MYQLLMEYEFGGRPFDRFDQYWARSPMKHIQNAGTPTLVTHGELDHDVPIGQSEEFFIGLQKFRVPSQFVRYPRESHGIREPQHTLDWMKRHIDWFDQHIKGAVRTKL